MSATWTKHYDPEGMLATTAMSANLVQVQQSNGMLDLKKLGIYVSINVFNDIT